MSGEVDKTREKVCNNLASFTKGVSVNTLDPGMAGMALSVTGQKSVLRPRFLNILTMMPPVWVNVQPQPNTSYRFSNMLSKKYD